MRRSLHGCAVALVCGLAMLPFPSVAVLAVVDHAAIANLIQQVAYWKQQIAGMSNQLQQLQSTYASTTGTRGMDGVLPTTQGQRNYLPADYDGLLSAASGTGGSYAGLSKSIQSVMNANAVLSQNQVAAMTPQMRQIVENGRRAAAVFSTASRTAYATTSQRFNALQQLIAAIRTAGDPKAIQDLQVRVSAEQAMLANEQAKLQALYQAAQAEQWAQQQRLREQVITGHGVFGNRFAPATTPSTVSQP